MVLQQVDRRGYPASASVQWPSYADVVTQAAPICLLHSFCSKRFVDRIVPITKRPCANCPFRRDGAGISLEPGRLHGIVTDLKADDHQTFICHQTLDKKRMTCAGAVGVMSKLGRLPVIARLGLAVGVITRHDIEVSAMMVIDPHDFE